MSLHFKSLGDIVGKHCKVLSSIGQKAGASRSCDERLAVAPALGAAAHKKGGKGPNKREIEGLQQTELLQLFRAQYAEIGGLLIHIPNGGSRKNAYEGWRLKQQGVRAGVSDLFLPVARSGYHGLWIEFKAEPPHDAPVSDSQEEWISLMNKQGYRAEVCLGATAAMSVLTSYLDKP